MGDTQKKRGQAVAAIAILQAAIELITRAGIEGPKPPGHDRVSSINGDIQKWQQELLRYVP